jgi:hypothetical protein
VFFIEPVGIRNASRKNDRMMKAMIAAINRDRHQLSFRFVVVVLETMVVFFASRAARISAYDFGREGSLVPNPSSRCTVVFELPVVRLSAM